MARKDNDPEKKPSIRIIGFPVVSLIVAAIITWVS